MNKINYAMQLALEAARNSGVDVPVGCAVVKEGKVLSLASNEREKINDPSAHAEILAIREACKKLQSWRLEGCELYVTLEPCPMCAWAILNSRISKVYFGAWDENYGALGSKLDLRELQRSSLEVYGGIMEAECREVLKSYFKGVRREK